MTTVSISRPGVDTSLDFLINQHGFIVSFFRSRYSRGLCAGLFSSHDEVGIFEDVLKGDATSATGLHRLIDNSSWIPFVADCMTVEEARRVLELRLLMLGQPVLLDPRFRYALQEVCRRLDADPLYNFDSTMPLDQFCDALLAEEQVDDPAQHGLIAIGVQARVFSVTDMNCATFITNADQLQTLQELIQKGPVNPAQVLSMHASAWFPIDHAVTPGRAFDRASRKLEKALRRDTVGDVRAALDKFYLRVKDNPDYVLQAGQSALEFLQT
jgi:hypothetical protein